MLDKIKSLGVPLLTLLSIVLLLLIAAALIHGGLFVGSIVLKYLFYASTITLAICLCFLLPLSFFPKHRLLASSWFFRSSYVFGATVWFWSLLLAYKIWGYTAVFLGLFLFGVGVAPVALLATLFNGMWSVFAQLVLFILLTFGCRFYAVYLETKSSSTYMPY